MQGGKKKKRGRGGDGERERFLILETRGRRGDQRTTEKQSEVDGLLKSSN